ncbi:MAG: hypothetical protein K2X77_13315, partial [Candidatus Obscuribacterales bacterium]|nr:hypothetical protein [Candidatus Obscuribacterales bacterium]
MTFSIFQVNLPFHAVYPYLKLRPPGASKSPEDWSAAETESLAIGDIVFLLEPIFSSYGNPKQGLGVSEGDSFRVTNMLMLFRQDAGYPMCISLTTDSYEMQFAETILCVKADLAKASGNGFYYLHAAKIPAANEGELAAIAEMHKWGNAGKRLEAPKGLAEPGYFFLNNLKAPVEPIYQKQLFDIEMCAYYLFTDNEQNFKGKAPDLTGFFEPVKRPENALAGIDLEASKPAPAPAPAAPSMSLNSLLSDDWSPTPAPAAPPKVPDVPVPPQPVPSQPPTQAAGKTPPHKLAAEIASLVEGFKKDAEPEPPKGKVSMAPSPGVKHAPPSVPAPPPVNQRGVELKPPNHPLQKPAGPGIGQLINMFGGGKKEEPPKQESPGVAPPPPVPMRGKEGEKTKPAEKLSNDLFTSEYLTTGDSSTGKRIAEESAKIAADEAARKVAEQTAKMLQEQKALEKEEAARKAAEEEAARKAAEEEAARKAAEEEAARKAAEEEAARKAAEEEAAR